MAWERQRGLAAVGIGLLAAWFFTFTYVFNRAVANDGGHWAWTASLRYLITLPLMLPLMPWQGGIAPVLRSLRKNVWVWLGCSAVGFVLFYLLLCFASVSGPAWLVAGSFQFTVVAGMLCAPFLYRDGRRKIPVTGLAIAAIILSGVVLMQFGIGDGHMDSASWLALVCVLGAAVAYPLGNRLLLLNLEKTGERLNATQRVFGMTLASQPFWLLVSAYAWQQSGPPPAHQIYLAAGVALTAGVIATILFFQATGMVQNNPIALGAVEAMQATELLFAVVLGVLFLNEALPQGLSILGACLVTIGVAFFAVLVANAARKVS